jgi:hypothetical protein
MTQYSSLETYISQFIFLAQDEIDILRMLYKDPRVDKTTYFEKLQQVQDNLKSTENAKDIVTELKAASEFVNMANLNTLKFDENPDFHAQILNHDLAIEVKNFRYRTEDSRDEISLRKAGQSGELVIYGNSAEVQTQIEDAIAKKVQNYHGTEALFLYFWSHSPHHVEDIEIECAARTIFYDERYSNLIGLFYRFNNRTVFVYPARSQGKYVEILGDGFFSKVL